MKNLHTFEQFINEAKKVANFSDSDAKAIWKQLISITPGEGNTNGRDMAKNWDVMKKSKGAAISKIEVDPSGNALVSFDVFPLDSKERSEYYDKVGSNNPPYMMLTLDGANVKTASFKEAWKMSSRDMSKFDQAYFNKGRIPFNK